MSFRLLEQKHTEQIKKLTYQWCAERELLTNQNIKLEEQLEQLLQDETRLRSNIASLKQVLNYHWTCIICRRRYFLLDHSIVCFQDYENLEKENRNLLDQLVNAENVIEELELEIQRLSLLKKKVSYTTNPTFLVAEEKSESYTPSRTILLFIITFCLHEICLDLGNAFLVQNLFQLLT